MTNYNERLDGIFNNLYIWDSSAEGAAKIEASLNDTKQSITSLIKELVAEAKPTNSETQRGRVIVYGDLSERELNIINQFEQNLLKALEEV